jgi:hypothetical protein
MLHEKCWDWREPAASDTKAKLSAMKSEDIEDESFIVDSASGWYDASLAESCDVGSALAVASHGEGDRFRIRLFHQNREGGITQRIWDGQWVNGGAEMAPTGH